MMSRPTKMIKALIRKCSLKEKYAYQTFTYFIPSPPKRDTGYREKQFDKIVSNLLKKGFEILSIHTQSISHEACGMWVILYLKIKSDQAANTLKLEEKQDESIDLENPSDEKIEGLYYID